jgi:hypothetical protein
VLSGDETAVPFYGRDLLLLGARRNSLLDLWEILRYGTDSFGDANYLSIYGLRPDDWYARTIRVLGRTAVECTPDHVASAFARDIAEVVGSDATGALVVDPFAGSANTLYWILRNLPGAHGIGFELDPRVCQLTKQNLSILGSTIEIVHHDYLGALRAVKVPGDVYIIAFIAPPWGKAFSPSGGLDLRETTPPITEIVDALLLLFPNPMLFAVQVVQNVAPDSLTELAARFDSSDLRLYDSNKSGQNKNGLLLATRGWRQRAQAPPSIDTIHRTDG